MLNFKLIVVPTDLSAHSLRAFPYAVALAESFGARLRVVYVQEMPIPFGDIGGGSVSNYEELATEARQTLGKMVREWIPDTIDAESHVVIGHSAHEIVKYAEETNADLIVMATHGRTGVSHMVMGSTAETIVRKSPCPVLTLKQPIAVSAPAAVAGTRT
jgi:nucleotide-binding universal stress UspA family protein